MAAFTLQHQTLISSPSSKSSKFVFKSPTISTFFPPTLKSNPLLQISSSNNHTTFPFSTKIHCLDGIHYQTMVERTRQYYLEKLREEEYALVGICNHPEASRLCYHALHVLHQNSPLNDGVCSIVSSKDGVLHSLSGAGTVFSEIFDECKLLDQLPGDSAIGYVQYSNVTPPFVDTCERFGSVSIAHSGTLRNYDSLRRMLEDNGVSLDTNSYTEVLIHLFDMFKARPSLISKIIGVCQQLVGSYSMVLLTDDNKLVAIKHRRSYMSRGRSLAMGRRSDGAIVFASHSFALDAVDATNVRPLGDSQIVVVDEHGGVQSFSLYSHLKLRQCIFEPLYTIRNSSKHDEKVWMAGYDFDRALGVILATDSPVDCDIVISGFKSNDTYGKAFGDTMGVPYGEGFVNEENGDEFSVNNTLELEGRRVVVVAGSIVSVTLLSKSVGLLRESGAKEVHMRIARPQHIGSCYDGAMLNSDKHVSLIDRVGWCYYDADAPTTSKKTTMLNTMSAEEIGADPLAFLSMDSLAKWFGSDAIHHCFSRCSLLPN